jgi:D-alanyl-D-alanine carboxypeptidase
MKKKRKVKKIVYYYLGIIICIFIAIVGGIKYIKYISSDRYKLGKLGYDNDQIEVILKLDSSEIKDVLSRDYDKTIVSFIKQKYFLYKNLDRYLAYYKKNKDDKLSHVVSIVNVKADYEWYDEDIVEATDTSQGDLILVNKFHYLTDDFVPDNIVDISKTHCYGDNETTEEVYKAFKNMWTAAKEEDLSLIITSSYRDYEFQERLWNSYANSNSESWADSISARAGYSEHQTGLSLDIVTYNSQLNDFEETDEFKWLQENAYKYGFILRYPKDKTDITGYDYESWHYRYVGKEVAKKIHDEDITYDEYYAYYIEGNKN